MTSWEGMMNFPVNTRFLIKLNPLFPVWIDVLKMLLEKMCRSDNCDFSHIHTVYLYILYVLFINLYSVIIHLGYISFEHK